MPKKKVGVKKRQKGSVTRPRTTTTKSGAKSRTPITLRPLQLELGQVLDLEHLTRHPLDSEVGSTRTPSVPPAGQLGTEQSATNADTKGSYPITVRQANALLAELGHCWITDHEVINLLVDLEKWIVNKE